MCSWFPHFLLAESWRKKKFVNSSSSCEIWSKVHRNICFVFSDIFCSVVQVSDIKTKRQMHKTHIRFWWNGVKIKNRQTDESNFKSDDNTKKTLEGALTVMFRKPCRRKFKQNSGFWDTVITYSKMCHNSHF